MLTLPASVSLVLALWCEQSCLASLNQSGLKKKISAWYILMAPLSWGTRLDCCDKVGYIWYTISLQLYLESFFHLELCIDRSSASHFWRFCLESVPLLLLQGWLVTSFPSPWIAPTPFSTSGESGSFPTSASPGAKLFIFLASLCSPRFPSPSSWLSHCCPSCLPHQEAFLSALTGSILIHIIGHLLCSKDALTREIQEPRHASSLIISNPESLITSCSFSSEIKTFKFQNVFTKWEYLWNW